MAAAASPITSLTGVRSLPSCHLAGPIALLVLGMGISEYGLVSRWRESLSINS